MAYNPTEWQNREVEKPRTYVIETNGDGTVTLVPAEGTVLVAGTPLNAEPLNNIEQGILDLENALTEHNLNYIRQPAFAQTGGSATAYSVALSPGPTGYYEGFGITIIPHINNGANATLNINGLGAIKLLDQRGNAYAAGRLLKGKPYTFRKVGADFLADSAGGNGTAQPAHVLAPYTFTNDNGEFTGTIPTITSGEDPALSVGQWANGDLAVYPREGYRKGGSGAGEIRVTTAQLQSVEGELRGNLILENNYIFGVGGTIPNLSARDHHMPGKAVTTWVGDRVFIQPPYGCFSGDSWVTYPAPTMRPENIKEGVNILGVQGNVAQRGRATSSNGWINMQATVDAPWEINVGYRPQLVFYQFWIYYGVTNIYNEYGMNMVWGYGMFSKSTSASMENNRAANGFSSGGSSSMSYPIGPQGDTWNLDFGNWQRPIDFNNWENINTPTRGNNTGYFGGMTETGFRIGYGHYFRDPRGQNAAQINYYII